MLARCDGEQKYYAIVDMLFQQQRAWTSTDKPLDALRQMMRQAGFSQEKFDSCLKDQKLYDAVNAVKNRGMETFKVDSTPTFFINGQRHPGNMSIDELEKIIKPILGGLRPSSRRVEAAAGGRHEAHPSSYRRLQDLRRADGFPHRAGTDGRRRAERLRQIQSRRGPPRSDGRELPQEHARVRNGRSDLRGPAPGQRATAPK